MRVGLGYDSHPFDESRPLVLGGVEFPGHPGLTGHSDGDAVAHALIDALLGAASLGDVGALFPDTDPALSGADSMELVSAAARAVAEGGYRLLNADVTVIAERPMIAPRAGEMRCGLADRLGVDPDRISVKGKRNEGMGWIGRGEGIAVLAVAILAERGGPREDPAPGPRGG